MEETKELQTMYKIFRCLIYLSFIKPSDLQEKW